MVRDSETSQGTSSTYLYPIFLVQIVYDLYPNPDIWVETSTSTLTKLK